MMPLTGRRVVALSPQLCQLFQLLVFDLEKFRLQRYLSTNMRSMLGNNNNNRFRAVVQHRHFSQSHTTGRSDRFCYRPSGYALS